MMNQYLDKLKVCDNFVAGECPRDEISCKFAHPCGDRIEIENGMVGYCFLSLQDNCERPEEECRFYHPKGLLKRTIERRAFQRKNGKFKKGGRGLRLIYRKAGSREDFIALRRSERNSYNQRVRSSRGGRGGAGGGRGGRGGFSDGVHDEGEGGSRGDVGGHFGDGGDGDGDRYGVNDGGDRSNWGHNGEECFVEDDVNLNQIVSNMMPSLSAITDTLVNNNNNSGVNIEDMSFEEQGDYSSLESQLRKQQLQQRKQLLLQQVEQQQALQHKLNDRRLMQEKLMEERRLQEIREAACRREQEMIERERESQQQQQRLEQQDRDHQQQLLEQQDRDQQKRLHEAAFGFKDVYGGGGGGDMFGDRDGVRFGGRDDGGRFGDGDRFVGGGRDEGGGRFDGEGVSRDRGRDGRDDGGLFGVMNRDDADRFGHSDLFGGRNGGDNGRFMGDSRDKFRDDAERFGGRENRDRYVGGGRYKEGGGGDGGRFGGRVDDRFIDGGSRGSDRDRFNGSGGFNERDRFGVDGGITFGVERGRFEGGRDSFGGREVDPFMGGGGGGFENQRNMMPNDFGNNSNKFGHNNFDNKFELLNEIAVRCDTLSKNLNNYGDDDRRGRHYSRSSRERDNRRDITPDYIPEDSIAICRRFKNGKCVFDKCKYAHPSKNNKIAQDMFVTVCRNFLYGSCQVGDCKYYHLPPRLVKFHSNLKNIPKRKIKF